MSRPEVTSPLPLDEGFAPLAGASVTRSRRAGKSKKPVVDKPKRARSKPTRTIDAVVREMGPHHAEALRILSKRDASFKAWLREEAARLERALAASARVEKARAYLAEAEAEHADAHLIAKEPKPYSDKLVRLARSIADESGVDGTRGDAAPVAANVKAAPPAVPPS